MKKILNVILLLVMILLLTNLLCACCSFYRFPDQYQPSEKMVIVHVTDLHLTMKQDKKQNTAFTNKIILNGLKLHNLNKYYSLEHFKRFIDRVATDIKPDIIVITGDLADNYKETEVYEFIHQQLQPISIPVFIVLGDHDVTPSNKFNNYQKWFRRDSFTKIEGEYKFIGVPVFPNAEDLEWLDSELADSKDYKVIICHHRMLKASFIMNVLSKVYVSSILAPKAKEMRAIIEKYDNVLMVLTGHSHTNYTSKVKGISYISTASLAEYPFEFRLITIDKNVKSKPYSIYGKGEKIP